MSNKIIGTVDQTRRGCSLKVAFSLSCDKNGRAEMITKDFEIFDLVMVRFKFEHEDQLKCSLSAMKLQFKGPSVQVIANCKDAKYSEKWQIHRNAWSEYKFMGCANNLICKDNVKLYLIRIDIIASEVNASNLHTNVYEDIDYIDFHLKAADGDVGVHKVFLAAHSDVFKRMLSGKWKETTEGCVEVEGVTRQTLQRLKDYMYLGILPEDGLDSLLLLAKYYLIDDLKTKCIKKLTETVKSDNLYALLELACENNIPELTFELLQVTPDEIVDDTYVKKKVSKPGDVKLKSSENVK